MLVSSSLCKSRIISPALVAGRGRQCRQAEGKPGECSDIMPGRFIKVHHVIPLSCARTDSTLSAFDWGRMMGKDLPTLFWAADPWMRPIEMAEAGVTVLNVLFAQPLWTTSHKLSCSLKTTVFS